jgi:putative transposase
MAIGDWRCWWNARAIESHKRLWRVYREAGLCLKRKKRRHCVRIGSPQLVLTGANQEWGLDFAPHDVLAARRSIRVLSVMDAFTRECLGWKSTRASPAGV